MCRIWDSLVEKEMSPPTQERWEEIEKEFNSCWNFPNCIGAVDGKHIVITAPFNSGSLFHNYKGTFSINLLALVDANYSSFSLISDNMDQMLMVGFSKDQSLEEDSSTETFKYHPLK